MTGMNASVSAGWYTFTNLGPLTTTFTPAPTCTDPGYVGLGYMNTDENAVMIRYATDDKYRSTLDGCLPPTSTAPPESTVHITSEEQMSAFEANRIDWRGYGAYYSPGLYCPSGWETVGLVGRDDSSSITSSGIYVPTTASTSSQTYPTSDFYHYMFNYEDTASVLKDILDPKQTMAACCPSGMTADVAGICYSVIEDIKPTVGYEVGVGYNYKYGSSMRPYTETEDSTTITDTGYGYYQTATVYKTDTYTASFDQAERSRYSAFSYAAVVTVLHHESDLQAASSASATGSAATTSNAAGRISASSSVWNGVGTVVGIWMAAAALGAAMILPW